MSDDSRPSITLSNGEYLYGSYLGSGNKILTNGRRVVLPVLHPFSHSSSVWSRSFPSLPFPLAFPYTPSTLCRHTIMIDTSVPSETPSRKREREISQEPMTPSVVCPLVYSVSSVRDLFPRPSLPSFCHPRILHPSFLFRSGENAWLTRGSIVSPLTLVLVFRVPLFPLLGVSFFV